MRIVQLPHTLWFCLEKYSSKGCFGILTAKDPQNKDISAISDKEAAFGSQSLSISEHQSPVLSWEETVQHRGRDKNKNKAMETNTMRFRFGPKMVHAWIPLYITQPSACVLYRYFKNAWKVSDSGHWVCLRTKGCHWYNFFSRTSVESKPREWMRSAIPGLLWLQRQQCPVIIPIFKKTLAIDTAPSSKTAENPKTHEHNH